MRRYEAQPARSVSGAVAVPGDKSISHRSLMLSGIAEGSSEVTGFLASEDCLATLTAMRALGVHIEQPSATHVVVHGVGLRGLRAAAGALDMGNAGTAMRLFTGLLSAQSFDSQLIGDASLMKRPMERVGRYRWRTQPARDRLSHAGGERAGEVGGSVGRPVRRRRHHGHRAGRQS
jgi:3-phosphoshikimate 1-carboxyvinyltransferase